MNTNIKCFDSPEDYADWLSRIPAHLISNSREDFSGAQLSEGVRILREGDTSRLNDAQAILDKVMVEGLVTQHLPILQASLVGFVPNVPAALAGHPESMFNRGFMESPTVNSPLTIYVETTVSAGVSQSELINRGVCILAFVLAMEQVRPVDLYIALPHSHSRKPGVYCPVIKIASRPMDLGRAVWMLTDPCFARRCFHTAINELSGAGQRCGEGPWAWGSSPLDANYEKNVRELLEMHPDDLFFKGGYLYDSLMRTDPIAWVQKMVNQHLHIQQENA
jgi:hypothetical protein